MKVQYSSEKINPFGGIFFVEKLLNNSNFYQFIDKELGMRPAQAGYSYSDIIKALFMLTLCGGDCAEDLTDHLKPYLSGLKGYKVPGADTVLRVQRSLATEKELLVTPSGIGHEFNVNMRMNQLMVKMLLHLKQLTPQNQNYTLDYDNQFIPTEKYDSKRSYKRADGYFPGIASIDNFPVYIENRNGNSNVKFKQEETLKRCYGLLKDSGIAIKRSRMDCGSFSEKIVEVVENNSQLFYIRAMRCDDLFSEICKVKKWQTIEIGVKEYQIASIEYAPFGGKKKYRYVISREKNKNGQLDILSKDDCIYRAIMTNDREMGDLDVILFYNQRAESERLFDEMNNDFNWSKLPFSFLQQNTVFMVIMAMCRNTYHFLLDFISKKIDFISPCFRLKKFIFRFMVIPVKWIRRARQDVLKVFADKQYHVVIT